ncbi:protein-L-isoaspartate(D-aspartate) O-methyltransferase [Aliikangiella marina]|uniref:Protein-L-isoaspartate O-methyltransferase n=1 Tax=Aliikangiella marina TaxID=1712262 RepID=A0A545T301_9GAMM|nr:protein-L-isoaspartate(D-aspartate) O-methyltransferase [Aliikangiella marina]TQV71592.1 protein-L-isoaspartate(D-aspartate) O-methyltransferase [Aliikangiella marina]
MITTNMAGIGMTSQRTRSRLIQRLRDKGIIEENVLSVMEQTPRHIFIDEALSHRAYEDTSLPIGMGQTISQPYIVARMTELLVMSGPMNDVLEIGTGCGYQTSILAGVSRRVYTIERIKPLQKQAVDRFKALNLHNVTHRHGDGFLGWEEQAPFDAIIVTAAPDQIPQPLIDQLAIGGRMVTPVTLANGNQELYLVEKDEEGISSMKIEEVKFVPLLGGTIE